MSDILLHGKAQKPLLLKTMPAHNIGSDGNFAISTITGKGVFLSAKTNGRWFSAGKMEELKTFDNKTIDNISTKILKVRKEISMGDSFKLNSNSLSVSTGDFAINSNENVLLNSDTAIDGDLDINGIQTITSKTKLINGLMSNPNLNLKYDDKNYVKFGTIKSGGLQIEPYKVDDVSGVTVGPIKLMYDETYYTTFQNDSSGNFTLASTGNATLDVAGDIELNADGGQVTIKDDSASHFLFDCDNTKLEIYDTTDTADLFSITIGASGATTIATVDDGAAVGHLTLVPDGDLRLDPASQKTIISSTDKLYFDGGTETYIFEEFNSGAGDILSFYVGGDKMLSLDESVDTGVTSLIGTLKIAEQANASADTAGYGQIWVDTATPNELAFTDDNGTDIIGIGKYHYDTKFVGYYTSVVAVFIPLNGSITEQIATATENEYVAMIAPYNGTIEKILWRSEAPQDGTLQMDIYESSDETEVPGTEIGTKDTLLDRINDDITVDVSFSSMTSGTNALVKGRIYAIKITSPSASNDTNATVVFKWDITH